jgi:hypothetical protein
VKKKRKSPTKSSERLYRPVVDSSELGELERRKQKDERGFAQWLRVFVALTAVLLLINLLTTFSDAELRFAERVWSLLAISPLSAITAIWWAQIRVGRRALEAQHILLAQRELNRHATGIRAAEERLRSRLERLSPRQGGLETLLSTAERASQRLLRFADGEEARGDLPARAARLDAYRVTLDSLGIDALLEPELLHSAGAREALEGATLLLANEEAA